MVFSEIYPIPVARLMMGLRPANLWFTNKKRQVTYIAPLRPLTLAAFRPWGGSAGAGRIRLAGHEGKNNFQINEKY